MQNILVVFITNTFLTPLALIFDPMHLVRYLLKLRLLKSASAQNKTCQYQANQILESPSFDICEKYATVNRTLLTAAFYAGILPFGSLLLILSLGLMYLSSKYLLIKRCSFTNSLSHELNDSMIGIATCLPLIFAGGFSLN